MKKSIFLFFITSFLVIVMLIGTCQQPSSSSGGGGGGSTPEDTAYKVTYDGNGNTSGNIPIDSNSYKKGQAVVVKDYGGLKKINVTGTSYRFEGWNTQPDGNGINYIDGEDTFIMGESNVVLYAKWESLAIRERTGPRQVAGGWIFYDKGNYIGGWRYLEVAETDQDINIQWYNGSYTTTGATESVIGKGYENTIKIVTNQGNGNYAAKLCYDYSSSGLGGIDDEWFLPSVEELKLMYQNLRLFNVGQLFGQYYWSSTEINSELALQVKFFDIDGGTSFECLKNISETKNVRAIRAF